MTATLPAHSAPAHSTGSTPAAPSPVPGAGASNPLPGTGAGASPANFWPWALAIVLFWFIIVALHEYGGAAQDVGTGFALLVLTTVLLTQGGKAMTNALALVHNG